MIRIGKASLLIFVLVLTFTGCQSKYEKIKLGMNSNEVIHFLGQPDYIHSHGRYWSYEKNGKSFITLEMSEPHVAHKNLSKVVKISRPK